MASRYKLVYFNGRARAELIRLIFHGTGEDFEDVRLDTGSWPQMKPNTPFGSLPILEFDGNQLAQSLAIARFLAREFGIAGKNRTEEALADSVVDATNDILGDLIRIIFDENDKSKGENRRKFTETTFPASLRSFEQFFEKYGRGGYVVGSSLTWADIAIFNAIDQVVQAGIVGWDYFDKYQNVKGLLRTIEETPRFQGYLKTRPHTPY